jgi:hypothetical protein
MQELVFEIFVNGEYKRTFVNGVQLDEFMKRVWDKDHLAKIEIIPVFRTYTEVK